MTETETSRNNNAVVFVNKSEHEQDDDEKQQVLNDDDDANPVVLRASLIMELTSTAIDNSDHQNQPGDDDGDEEDDDEDEMYEHEPTTTTTTTTTTTSTRTATAKHDIGVVAEATVKNKQKRSLTTAFNYHQTKVQTYTNDRNDVRMPTPKSVTAAVIGERQRCTRMESTLVLSQEEEQLIRRIRSFLSQHQNTTARCCGEKTRDHQDEIEKEIDLGNDSSSSTRSSNKHGSDPEITRKLSFLLTRRTTLATETSGASGSTSEDLLPTTESDMENCMNTALLIEMRVVDERWVKDNGQTFVMDDTSRRLSDPQDDASVTKEIQGTSGENIRGPSESAVPLAAFVERQALQVLRQPGAFAMNGVNSSSSSNNNNQIPEVLNERRPLASTTTRELSHRAITTQQLGSNLPIQASIVNEENAVRASVLTPEDMEELTKPGIRKRLYTLLGLLVCAIVAIIVGVVVSVTTRSSEVATIFPTMSPTFSPTLTLSSRVEYLQNLVINRTMLIGSNHASLVMPNTPQHKAFQWLTAEQEQRGLDQDIYMLQRYILAVLYYATSGPEWTAGNTFLSDQDECKWMVTGVTCDTSGIITELDLSSSGLDGPIPHELFALTSLIRLALPGNKLSGTIPPYGMAGLTLLKELDLGDNSLIGSIPTEIGALSSMEIFRMGNNALHGSIPAGITNFVKLNSFDVLGNDMTGSIPHDLYTVLTNLREIRIGQNPLTGSLPTEVGNLVYLTSMACFAINFNGTFPSELGLLTQLTNLQLSDMGQYGTIPTELGKLTKLSRLALSYNDITGTVPSEFGNLKSLSKLYFQGMALHGNITWMCDELPPLNPFRVDLQEVACECCTCCDGD